MIYDLRFLGTDEALYETFKKLIKVLILHYLPVDFYLNLIIFA